MKKILLFMILTFICSSAIKYKDTIQDDDNIIPWSVDRKLIWEDFRGVSRRGNSNKVAETSSIISVKYKYNSRNKVTSYDVIATFNKNNSWTVSNDKKVLAHEQLHFDITELYARRLRKSFDSLMVRNNNIKIYSKIYSSNIQKWKKEQNSYDNQVYGNKVQQERWIKKINSQLDQSRSYEYVLND